MIGGYHGKLLRVDLTHEKFGEERLVEKTLRDYIGGTGIGSKYLYEEVPPEVGWAHPDNRMIFASGPLGGTRIGGSGTFSLVTKGALTEGATSTQANGFFGAFLKLCGLDGLIIQGAAREWVYLHISDSSCELRSADHLIGMDTWETEDLIKQELGKKERQMSVFGIGPAGENLVRFAGIFGDKGHAAPHNGSGAVMGSKRLKAIAIARGSRRVPVKDAEAFAMVANEFMKIAKASDYFKYGTRAAFMPLKELLMIPVKNYTTSFWKIDEGQLAKFEPEYMLKLNVKRNSCWACQMRHCQRMEILEGRYKGMVVEEPEYEQLAAFGPLIDQTDVESAMMLSNVVDRLGMDANECGWILSWLMDCYEKGVIQKKELDGIEMKWGDAEASRKIMNLTATREGIGDLLAEGVMRVSRKMGGEAARMAIYTMKGNTPRSHDHRTRISELFDTCVSNTGTFENHMWGLRNRLGLTEYCVPGRPLETAKWNARTKGTMQFEDSLGVCRFNVNTNIELLSKALGAITGWKYTPNEAMTMGKRIVNILRVFNIRHGITGDLDYPSPRYGSALSDGPYQGYDVMVCWKDMLNTYYREMGWDEETGTPRPETLKGLGLEHMVKDIWGC